MLIENTTPVLYTQYMLKKIFWVILFWGFLGFLASRLYSVTFDPSGNTLKNVYEYCSGENMNDTKCYTLPQNDLKVLSASTTTSIATFVLLGWVLGTIVEVYKYKKQRQ